LCDGLVLFVNLWLSCSHSAVRSTSVYRLFAPIHYTAAMLLCTYTHSVINNGLRSQWNQWQCCREGVTSDILVQLIGHALAVIAVIADNWSQLSLLNTLCPFPSGFILIGDYFLLCFSSVANMQTRISINFQLKSLWIFYIMSRLIPDIVKERINTCFALQQLHLHTVKTNNNVIVLFVLILFMYYN